MAAAMTKNDCLGRKTIYADIAAAASNPTAEPLDIRTTRLYGPPP